MRTPLDLAHRVRVPVSSCARPAQRFLLKRAFNRALLLERRVFVIGIANDGRIVMCAHPDCHHGDDVPSVIPWDTAFLMQINGWQRPSRTIDLHAYGLYDFPHALAVGWHPTVWLPEWWMEENGE
jgi:hypothetical protein